MKQELFTPRQLLKSNDGKEYIIFNYYIKDGRKCEECTPYFRGNPVGSNHCVFKRATDDFHAVSDVERQLVDDATEYRSKAANAFFEARRRLREVEDRENNLKEISGLDEHVSSIYDILDDMTKSIDDVMRYTGKDYIKGEAVISDLVNIREFLNKIREVTIIFRSENPSQIVYDTSDERF